MGTQLSLQTVRGLLHLEGDHNFGQDQGHAFNRLVSFIKAADEETREWVAERYPEVVVGVELLMRTHWALDWMRTLVKRAEAGLDMGDEIDLMAVSQPHPPVSASDHVAVRPKGRVAA